LTIGFFPLNSSAKNLDSHIIQLLQAEPYPIRDGEIAKGDYRATLIALPAATIPMPTGKFETLYPTMT
jgi:hypothetical protein